MITKIPTKGSHPLGLLHYLTRGRRSWSQLLDTNLHGSSIRSYARQIEKVSWSHRPGLAKFVKHIIFSFPPGEELPLEEVRSILHFYLERMGYAQAPFVAYLHSDTPQQHVHIVTTPTTWGGEAISESWDWPRSERAARAIERRWGLTAVPSSDQARVRAPSRREVQAAARTGVPSSRSEFQLLVSEAAFRSRTLPELLERLEAEGVRTRVLLDRHGRLRGVSFAAGEARFKGSQLGRDFRGGNFLTAFGIDYDPERHARAVERFRRPLPAGEDLEGRAMSRGENAQAGATPAAPDLLPWERPGNVRQRLRSRAEELDRQLAPLRRQLWRLVRREGTAAPGSSAERLLPLGARLRAAVEVLSGEPLPFETELVAAPEVGRLELRVPAAPEAPAGSSLALLPAPGGHDEFRMRNSPRSDVSPTVAGVPPSPAGSREFRMRNSSLSTAPGDSPQATPAAEFRMRNSAPGQGEAPVATATAPPPDYRLDALAEVLAAAPSRPRDAPGLTAERMAIAHDLTALEARPGTAARDLESLPWRVAGPALPAGRYHLAAVAPEELYRNGPEALGRLGSAAVPGAPAPQPAAGSRRLVWDDLAWVRRGWGVDAIRKARGWLLRENRERVLLIRPDSAEETFLGFRSLSRGQVDSLVRDGIEPAWLVRRGRRYDLLLRTHQRLSPPEKSALRRHLVRRYGLPAQRGVFQDAVHLPGSAAVPGLAAGRAELLEVREEPFSASPRLLARVQAQAEEAELVRGARRVELPEDADRLPAAALAEVAQERPAYPEAAPLAGVQRRIEGQVRAAGSAGEAGSFHEVPDSEIVARATRANRELIDLAVDGSAGPGEERGAQDLAASPAAERLYTLEAEIARRRAAFERELAGAEERLAAATHRLDELAVRFERRPDPALIDAYHEAAEAFGRAAGEHRAVEERYLAATAAQVTLDRQRYAAALLAAGDDEAAHEAYGRLVSRELLLGRQAGAGDGPATAGGDPGVAPEPPASAAPQDAPGAAELRRRLEEVAGRAAEARAALREAGPGGRDALAAYENLRHEEERTRLLLARAQAREAAPGGDRGMAPPPRPAVAGAAPGPQPAPPPEEAPPAASASSRPRVGEADDRRPAPSQATPPTDPEQALAELFAHKGALDERGRLETALEAAASDPAGRLRQAARRVAGGDVSSEGLRRLNTEILASRAARDLVLPVFQLPGRPLALYERYRELGREVQALAGEVAGDASRAGPRQLARLFQRSSELVTLHRRLESLERRLLAIADPGPAPEGVSPLAWSVAWLERAAAKGLLPPAASAHLANAPRMPLAAAGAFSSGRVAFAAYWLGRWALRAGWRWSRRVLSQ